MIFPRTGRRLPCTARSQRPDRRPATGLLSSSACFWEAGHTQFWKAGFGRDVCALSLNAKGWENPSSVPIDPSSEHWDLPAPGSHLHPSARLGPARPRHATGGGFGGLRGPQALPQPSPGTRTGRGRSHPGRHRPLLGEGDGDASPRGRGRDSPAAPRPLLRRPGPALGGGRHRGSAAAAGREERGGQCGAGSSSDPQAG